MQRTIAAAFAAIAIAAPASAELLDVEKDELKFGFIKLTDMAPLAVAYEKGYFEDEGLFVPFAPGLERHGALPGGPDDGHGHFGL